MLLTVGFTFRNRTHDYQLAMVILMLLPQSVFQITSHEDLGLDS
jgi:hypothetical protein